MKSKNQIKLPVIIPEVAKSFHNHDVTNMPRVKKKPTQILHVG